MTNPEFEAKTEQLLDIIARTDSAGHIAELAPPPTPETETETEPPRPGPVDQGPRQTVPPPTLGEQIRAAESAGDFDTARRLKLQQLTNLATGVPYGRR